LITGALRLGLGTEVLDQVIIEHDGDAGLAGRGHHVTPLGLGEVLSFTH
jgi:hypothetical protein